MRALHKVVGMVAEKIVLAFALLHLLPHLGDLQSCSLLFHSLHLCQVLLLLHFQPRLARLLLFPLSGIGPLLGTVFCLPQCSHPHLQFLSQCFSLGSQLLHASHSQLQLFLVVGHPGLVVSQKSLVAGSCAIELLLDSVVALLGGGKGLPFGVERGNDGVFVVEGRLVVFEDGPEGSFASFSKQTHILIFENN